jgi:predicted RNA-binding Zn ribbon-like protein
MTAPPPAVPGRLDLVRRFVNTLDVETGKDRLTSPDALVGWLHDTGLLTTKPAASPALLRKAIAVREALRDLLRSHHADTPVGPPTVQVLNGAAGDLSVSFSAAEGWTIAPRRGGIDGAISELLAIAIRATADGTWHRLKVCANDDCEWAFYDRSRARSGRWCSMETCGNRAKQQAWRSKRATSGGPSTTV